MSPLLFLLLQPRNESAPDPDFLPVSRLFFLLQQQDERQGDFNAEYVLLLFLALGTRGTKDLLIPNRKVFLPCPALRAEATIPLLNPISTMLLRLFVKNTTRTMLRVISNVSLSVSFFLAVGIRKTD